jgi:polynucleotide 5'-kinase involved in rRNA processing
MFGKDVVELTLQYIPYEAYLFTTLSLISKQWNKLVETEEVWRKIFFKKYPMARGVLTHDFKRAYMEMLWYTKNNKKEFEKKELKLVLLGSKRSGKTSLVQHFASTQFYGYLNAYYPTT